MHAGGRNDEKHLSKRKPPVASSALVSGRSRDTGLGNMVSRPAGKQGVSHRTDSSLPETAAPVNRPAPDFSTAAEPPAPPRRMPDISPLTREGVISLPRRFSRARAGTRRAKKEPPRTGGSSLKLRNRGAPPRDLPFSKAGRPTCRAPRPSAADVPHAAAA